MIERALCFVFSSPLCFGIGIVLPSDKPLTGSKQAPLDNSHIHCTVNFMDNLNIKGIEDDNPRRRGKTRGKARRPFAIEARLVHDPDAPSILVSRQLGLGKWWVRGRYTTSSRRDQAYAALVKKEASSHIPRWARWEFRKRDD